MLWKQEACTITIRPISKNSSGIVTALGSTVKKLGGSHVVIEHEDDYPTVVSITLNPKKISAFVEAAQTALQQHAGDGVRATFFPQNGTSELALI